MKKIIADSLGIILSLLILALILVVVFFYNYVEAIVGFVWIIAIILLLLLWPIFLIIEYRKKIRRIEYLENILRDNNISFYPEE